MEPSTITLIIIGITLILYVSERIPIATTSIIACLAFALTGVIPFSDAFAGFGNDVVFLIMGMMIVGSALYETGVAQLVGKTIVSLVGASVRLFSATIIVASVGIGVFLNNSATAALMLPIAASAIAASKGVLSKKNTFMMVGIAVCISGGIALVGSPPNLIAHAFLVEHDYGGFSFFELGKFGLPVMFLALAFFLTIGMKLQKKVFNFPETADAAPTAKEEAPRSKVKMCLSVAILAFCIVGLIGEWWRPGIVAMIGAALCVVTGCISQKKVFQKMDWTTVVIMGCSFAFAHALDQSGAGRMIAGGMISILGENLTPWLLLSALTLITMILTNFMSSTAAASMLVPIAAFAAIEVGFDVRAAVMIIAVAANIGYATPVSTPPMTMTLPAGYRFMDYVKVGGLFNLLAFLLVVALIPIMFAL
ncbi:MAG: SLC13 family permease [Defluviitaleaceae bacterium]|nr:SLC13 family permease [Defluviitaleaceae bacterium]